PYAKWGIQYVAPNVLASGSLGGLNFWIPSGSQFGDNYLFLADNGNVGLGTAIIPSEYKLAVNGKIIAEEVTVGLTANWPPDFVFENDYNLMSLYELDKYIGEKKHLPGVPSAKEFKEQNNKINISDMLMQLLQKQEETVLHLIELKKENDELKKEIEELKNK
ncbi:MAG: hypothetical protein HY840_03175, partial [Bacteroidetes bacterium]|nr:hypothetical protein [Bacteroidota bacterium]